MAPTWQFLNQAPPASPFCYTPPRLLPFLLPDICHCCCLCCCRFLNGVEGFDAASFGIASSEALLIDPQQRMMLEVGCSF